MKKSFKESINSDIKIWGLIIILLSGFVTFIFWEISELIWPISGPEFFHKNLLYFLATPSVIYVIYIFQHSFRNIANPERRFYKKDLKATDISKYVKQMILNMAGKFGEEPILYFDYDSVGTDLESATYTAVKYFLSKELYVNVIEHDILKKVILSSSDRKLNMKYITELKPRLEYTTEFWLFEDVRSTV